MLAVLAFTLRSYRNLTPEQREAMRARQGDDPLADPRWYDSHRGADDRADPASGSDGPQGGDSDSRD